MLKSVTDFIYQCGSVPFNGNGKKRWMAMCGATLWTIWLARNESIFNGKEWKGEEVVFLCKLRAFYWINEMEKVKGLGRRDGGRGHGQVRCVARELIPNIKLVGFVFRVTF